MGRPEGDAKSLSQQPLPFASQFYENSTPEPGTGKTELPKSPNISKHALEVG